MALRSSQSPDYADFSLSYIQPSSPLLRRKLLSPNMPSVDAPGAFTVVPSDTLVSGSQNLATNFGTESLASDTSGMTSNEVRLSSVVSTDYGDDALVFS